MKFLILIVTLVFATLSFAEEVQDLSKMLAESRCIPMRGSDGNISGYNCEGPLGEKIKQEKFQNRGMQKEKKIKALSRETITLENDHPVSPPPKDMEIYNSIISTQ